MLIRPRWTAGAAVSAAAILSTGGAWAPPSGAAPTVVMPAAFRLLQTGPDGGTVWTGRIPNGFVPWDHRDSDVYLPPDASSTARYPVVYLLHGMTGSPSSLVDSMQLAKQADTAIASGRAAPFIAVAPVGGPLHHRGAGEWAAQWEQYVVDDVVPWADRRLPTIPRRTARTIAGLSAGGFGAIDIGLRHPMVFGTLESWGGYFAPLHDGPFRKASPAALAAHTPVILVREEAARLRALRTRFYLSSGPSHSGIHEESTIAFARELHTLRLSCRLLLVVDSSPFVWRAQLGPGLLFAAGARVGTTCTQFGPVAR